MFPCSIWPPVTPHVADLAALGAWPRLRFGAWPSVFIRASTAKPGVAGCLKIDVVEGKRSAPRNDCMICVYRDETDTCMNKICAFFL